MTVKELKDALQSYVDMGEGDDFVNIRIPEGISEDNDFTIDVIEPSSDYEQVLNIQCD